MHNSEKCVATLRFEGKNLCHVYPPEDYIHLDTHSNTAPIYHLSTTKEAYASPSWQNQVVLTS